jgi:HNH endonuclease
VVRKKIPKGFGRLPKRFQEKIEIAESGCWVWTGAKAGSGYGQVYRAGKNWLAHRAVWEILVGPIPQGMQLDHVKVRGCTVRSCCNPAHLEIVTRLENMKRQGEGNITCYCGHCLTCRNREYMRGFRVRQRARSARS